MNTRDTYGFQLLRAVRRVNERIDAAIEAIQLPPATVGLLRGGKRLRTQMAFASACGPTPDFGTLTTAAAVIELIHSASLIHDDIVDDCILRRSGPAVHTVLGTRGATLSAAIVVSVAFSMMATLPARIRIVLSETAHLVSRGQFSETMRSHDGTVTVSERLRMILDKTASVFSLASRLGGMLSGATDTTCAHLARFGLNFGMLFQVADDVDDLYASSAVLGRAPGADLRQGIVSVPFAIALDSAFQHEVLTLLESATVDPQAYARARAILLVSDALRRTHNLARRYAGRAHKRLTFLPHGPHRVWLASVLSETLARAVEPPST